MSSSPPSPVFYAKLASILASVVAFGFVVWAGVVWSIGQNMESRVFELSTSIAKEQVLLTTMNNKMDRILSELASHELRPWHDRAGNELSKMRSEIDTLRRIRGE